MPPLRAAIVAAVSDPSQAAEDKASIPEQLEDGRTTCEARHWTPVAEIVIPGHSRNYDWLDQLRADCREYDELVRLIDAGALDVVVCRDYDRLWRTVSLQSQVMARCKEHRVQVLSLNQPDEIVPPEMLAERGTRLGPLIFSWLSEEENRIRAARHKVGMHGRIRRGLYTGGITPYGYSRVATDEPLAVDEEQARWVRWIYQRRAEGWGYIRIFRRLDALGVPGPSGGRWNDVAVSRILHSAIYAGAVAWGSAVNREAGHPLIIEEALWRTVQGVNRSRQGRYRSGRVRALSGLTVCGECGRGLGYTANNRGYVTLRCPRTNRYPADCRFGAISAQAVEQAVMEAALRALASPEDWLAAQRERANGTEVAARIAELERSMAEQSAMYERWNSLYERGGITAEELLMHRQRIIGQVEQLREEHEALDAKRRDLDGSYRTLVDTAPLRDTLPSLSPEQLRDVYRELIERVIVTKSPARTIEIVWR